MKKRSSLDRLLENLFSDPHDYKASTNIFPDIDPRKIAKKFELEARGKERASGGESVREPGQLDDIEMEIVEHIKSAQSNAHQILDEEMQTYAMRLSGLNFQQRVTEIKTTAPDCIVEFRTERSKGEKELHQACTDFLEHHAEREDFREAHRLKRPARIHSTATSYLKWGFLILLLAVECALNGSFLAKGSELGLVGGISEALAFAALNVGAALAAATLGARLLTHRNFLLKLVGAVTLVVWICFAALLNLALAHYREVAGSLASDGGREVVARLQEAPLALSDVQSWVLFGIGVLFAIAAFIDGLLIYDPYWGYGGAEKRLRKARQAYHDVHADLVDELQNIYSEYSATLGEIGRDLDARLGEYGRIIESRKRRLEQFNGHQAQLETAANVLLTTYRKARGLPAEEPYHLEKIPVMPDNPNSRQRKEIEDLVKSAHSVLLSQIERLRTEFEQGMTEYDEIHAMYRARLEPDGGA